MKPKTARKMLRRYRWQFATNKLDNYRSKKLKKFYRSLLKTLRLDVRNTKNPASIRILNECVNQ